MDDFARGELLWVRRELNNSDSCGLCLLIEDGLTEPSGNQLSIGYIECFSELRSLWDHTVVKRSWNNGVLGDYEIRKEFYKMHLSLWWPLDSYGNKLRIRAIDFLLTGRQGATYTSYKPQGETK